MLYVDSRERVDSGDRIVADHTHEPEQLQSRTPLDRFSASGKNKAPRITVHTFHDDGAGACTVGDLHIGAVTKAVLEEAPGGMT